MPLEASPSLTRPCLSIRAFRLDGPLAHEGLQRPERLSCGRLLHPLVPSAEVDRTISGLRPAGPRTIKVLSPARRAPQPSTKPRTPSTKSPEYQKPRVPGGDQWTSAPWTLSTSTLTCT